jgi:hypothetical protein
MIFSAKILRVLLSSADRLMQKTQAKYSAPIKDVPPDER